MLFLRMIKQQINEFYVLVAPMVRAPSQLLGTPLGSDVQLECHVEASPSPVSYWLKGARAPSGFASVSNNNLEGGQPGPEMLLDGYVTTNSILLRK